MKAVCVQEDKTVKVEEKPVPTIGPNQILLKVRTVGVNPTDWKHAAWLSKPGFIIGCDFVGEVLELGADVPKDEVKVGELRWGSQRGGVSATAGSFAEFVALDWDTTSVVPPNVTAEEAASIPIPWITTVQVFWHRLKLPLYPGKADGEWILIWSGSTAVGQYAIQLAKLIGLKVATTASPQRWELLKSLGADVVVDYKDPEVIEKLKAATNDSIQYGLDGISEKDSTKICQLAFRPEGGHLVTLLPVNTDELPRSDVVKTEDTLAYTMAGKEETIGPKTYKPDPEERPLLGKSLKLCTELLKDGKLKPMSVEVVGKLEDTQAAFDILKSGKNTTKLVLSVA